MANKNVSLVKNFRAPIAVGRHYRLLCMTGENKGFSYYLTGVRILMGRSEDADITVADSRSSREHVELAKIKDDYILTDLGSQNGVIVNDLKVNQYTLSDGDKIVIGQTVYKFFDQVIGPELEISKVKDNKKKQKKDKQDEVGTADDKKPKKNKRLIIFGAVGLLLLLMLGDGEEKGSQKKKKVKKIKDISESYRDLIVKKYAKADKEQRDKINSVLHRGLREFREGNYFRAKVVYIFL